MKILVDYHRILLMRFLKVLLRNMYLSILKHMNLKVVFLSF